MCMIIDGKASAGDFTFVLLIPYILSACQPWHWPSIAAKHRQRVTESLVPCTELTLSFLTVYSILIIPPMYYATA